MNNFVDFWVGLGYNGWLFLLLILLFFAHLIMIILRSTVLTTKKRPATVEPEEGVSVIITCSNKAELLKQKNVPRMRRRMFYPICNRNTRI